MDGVDVLPRVGRLDVTETHPVAKDRRLSSQCVQVFEFARVHGITRRPVLLVTTEESRSRALDVGDVVRVDAR